MSGSSSLVDLEEGCIIDAAEPGRLIVLGEGGIRAVVDPRRDGAAMTSVDF